MQELADIIPIPNPQESIPLNLSTPNMQPAGGTRFKFTSEEEYERLAKGVIPQNTSRSTKWALKTFDVWLNARNQDRGVESVPADLLTDPNIDQLNKYLSQFVVEARKSNGENYPPATLHQILCGIMRHMREITPDCPNFLNKSDEVPQTSYTGHLMHTSMICIPKE